VCRAGLSRAFPPPDPFEREFTGRPLRAFHFFSAPSKPFEACRGLKLLPPQQERNTPSTSDTGYPAPSPSCRSSPSSTLSKYKEGFAVRVDFFRTGQIRWTFSPVSPLFSRNFKWFFLVDFCGQLTTSEGKVLLLQVFSGLACVEHPDILTPARCLASCR